MNEARRPSRETAPLAYMVQEALLQLGTEADVEAVIRRACLRGDVAEIPGDALDLILFVCGPLHEATHELLGAQSAFELVSELRPTLEVAVHIDAAGEPSSDGSRPRSGVIGLIPASRPPYEAQTDRAPDSSRPDTMPYLGTPSRRGDIVLVEPDDERRRALCVTLGQKGYDVIAVADGASALVLSQRLRPAALLVAEDMPEIDGVELAHVLQESDRILATPVVIMTAESTTRELPERAWWAPIDEGVEALLDVLSVASKRLFAPEE